MYKNYDPRATIIKKVADDVFAIAGRDPLIDIAVELEKIARSDDYFISRKLYPNVDFYSGQLCHTASTALQTKKEVLVSVILVLVVAVLLVLSVYHVPWIQRFGLSNQVCEL